MGVSTPADAVGESSSTATPTSGSHEQVQAQTDLQQQEVEPAQQRDHHQKPTPPPQQQEMKVQVDMSNFVGRLKEKPVCKDETLKEEAMTTEHLSQMVFPVIETTKGHSINDTTTPAATGTPHHQHHHQHQHQEHSTVVSSSSSIGSRESAWSDHEASAWINHKVTTQSVSRNGRQSQRWQTDAGSQRMYRLVTGCVPIVEGGKILFASSSRKPEWILPKGGWEKDEEMEESAIRETFEEAGVLGILGPRLSEFEYETRKAKKRRLEFEEIQRKAKQMRDAAASNNQKDDVAAATTSTSSATKDQSSSDDTACQTTSAKSTSESTSLSSPPSTTAQHVPDKVLHRIRGHGAKSHHSSDVETASVASESSTNTYTHVRMNLIPLYVTEVRGEWPEQGRFRKAVDIDEAIRMTESRPEFQAALIEVKERNLHLPQLNKTSTAVDTVTPSLTAPSPQLNNTVSSGAEER